MLSYTLTSRVLVTALMLGLSAAPVYADKPSWAGGGNKHAANKSEHRKNDKKGSNNGNRGGDVNISIGAYFVGTQRQVVRDYYGSQFKSGHCPPGLAKKNNGCQPPGQAKKWSRGHALPNNVTYYSVPGTLITGLGLPPAGHKYVRVASDILLITIGTSMVVDAVEDLGGL